MRLLGLTADEVASYSRAVRGHDRRAIPGPVRASAGLSTTEADIDRLVAAVADVASGRPAPVAYEQDPVTGDYHVTGAQAGWLGDARALGASCARG